MRTIATLLVGSATVFGWSQSVPAELVDALRVLDYEPLRFAAAVLAPPQPQRLNGGANDEWRGPVRTKMIRFLKSTYAPGATQAIPGFELPDMDVLRWTYAVKPESLWYYDLEGTASVLFRDGTTSSVAGDAQLKSFVFDRIKRVLNLQNPSATQQTWGINRQTLPSGQTLAYGYLYHDLVLQPNGVASTPVDWDSKFVWWTNGDYVYFEWVMIDRSVVLRSGNKGPVEGKIVRLKPG